MYSIREAVTTIPGVVKQYIFIIHGWSGCDTTSSTFGQGKTHLMKHLVKSKPIQKLCNVIEGKESSTDVVGNTGMKLFRWPYGDESNNLTDLLGSWK